VRLEVDQLQPLHALPNIEDNSGGGGGGGGTSGLWGVELFRPHDKAAAAALHQLTHKATKASVVAPAKAIHVHVLMRKMHACSTLKCTTVVMVRGSSSATCGEPARGLI
jgi:hypothetical protein